MVYFKLLSCPSLEETDRTKESSLAEIQMEKVQNKSHSHH